jgi:hypothetical protein
MPKHAPTAIPTMAKRATKSALVRSKCDIGLPLEAVSPSVGVF